MAALGRAACTLHHPNARLFRHSAFFPPLVFPVCTIGNVPQQCLHPNLRKRQPRFSLSPAARVTLLTYEGAPLGVEFAGHADAGAQVQHDEHGGDHHNALHQQQRLKVSAKSVGGESVGWQKQTLSV